MDSLSPQFARFLQERKWVKNLTPKTLGWYEEFFKLFKRLMPEVTDPAQLTPSTLNTLVVRMREARLCPVSVNTRLRALNAFCRWLHAEGQLPTLLKQTPLRTEKNLIPVLTEVQLKRLFAMQPKQIREWRAYTLDCLLLDTGLRIEEALQLTRADVDLDNLLIKVKGKGRKERLVPFSTTLRLMLVSWRKRVERKGWDTTTWVFPTSQGTRLTQRNMLRPHHQLLRLAGIPRCGFHRLRHSFATHYLQNGGEVVRLSRILGHSQITTTMKYLHLVTEDLQKPHQQLSALNRLR